MVILWLLLLLLLCYFSRSAAFFPTDRAAPNVLLRTGVVRCPLGMGVHYRGVQWEGGTVDGDSIIK